MKNSIGLRPIAKVLAAFVAATVPPALLSALNVFNATDIDWKLIGAAALGGFITAATAYLKPFADAERYQRFE